VCPRVLRTTFTAVRHSHVDAHPPQTLRFRTVPTDSTTLFPETHEHPIGFYLHRPRPPQPPATSFKSLAPYRGLARRHCTEAVDYQTETVSIGTTWRKPLGRRSALWSYKCVLIPSGSFRQVAGDGIWCGRSLQASSFSVVDEQPRHALITWAWFKGATDTILHVRHAAHNEASMSNREEPTSCRKRGIGSAAVTPIDSARYAWGRGNKGMAKWSLGYSRLLGKLRPMAVHQ
jgi:hypothetical protein